jgi:hypothetical protein
MAPSFLPRLPRGTWLAIAAITLFGLALRIAAGRGGLWMDEAWSMMFADQTRSWPAVFLYINHDNNHHLNTLWMQLVGIGAPPLAVRALAIVSSSAAIFVAALLGARRGPTAAWVTALLFALAEAMVTYGSEARGYAPMLLALLALLLVVERWLDSPDAPAPTRWILLWCALGTLASLTMLFGIVAVSGYGLIALLRRGMGPLAALIAAARLLAPGIAAAALVVAVIVAAALASPAGFQIGNFTPFSLALFGEAMKAIVFTTLMPRLQPPWLAPGLIAALLLLVALRRPALLGPRTPFYLLAIIAFPLSIAVLQMGNSVFLRYYLLTCAALLLVAGEIIARGWDAGGWRKSLAAAALVAIAGTGLARDIDLIRNQRGDPAGPVRTMAALQPQGTRIAIEYSRAEALLSVAARQRGYPLEIVRQSCPDTRFLLVDRDPGKPGEMAITRCGRTFVARASARTTGLSGGDWTLYEQARLPSAATPVSEPPPAP